MNGKTRLAMRRRIVCLWAPRGIYRARIGGKAFYFGSDEAEATEEAATIRKQWKAIVKGGGSAWPEGQPDRTAIRAALSGNARLMAIEAGQIGNGSAAVAPPAPLMPAKMLIAASALSVENAAKVYIDEREKQGKPVKDAKWRLGVALDILGRSKPLVSIDRAALNDFSAALRAKGWSVPYAKNILGAVRDFLKKMASHEKINWTMPGNFLEALTSPSAKRSGDLPKTKARHYSVAELASLYAAADARMKAFILLGLNCAYYAEDIADLKAEHIETEGKTTVLHNARKKTGVERKYPLWPETVKALESAADSKSGYLFRSPNAADGLLSTSTVNKQWEALRLRAGVPNAIFSGLRDTSANDLKALAAADGLPSVELSELHLAHKHAADGGTNEDYAARQFAMHSKLIMKMRKRYAPLFK